MRETEYFHFHHKKKGEKKKGMEKKGKEKIMEKKT